MHIDPPTWHDASRLGKRSFDLVALRRAAGPLLPAAGGRHAWVRLHDGGPVLFRQRRVGRDGEPFDCLKFRSMVVDAEEQLALLKEAEGFESGLFKMKDDPRVTRPGRWLRRFSIDEFPQLVTSSAAR